jgi:hypothetical protein
VVQRQQAEPAVAEGDDVEPAVREPGHLTEDRPAPDRFQLIE